jgi:hypothetical protein
MYSFLLTVHSLFRWVVLASLLFALFNAYRGWLSQKNFTVFDHKVIHVAAAASYIQFLIGLCLYFVSPIVHYFYGNFSTALHERSIRFFGMEHITMMFIAVSLISASTGIIKKKTTDTAKHKTLAIFFSIALLIIFLSIPWQFSPFTSRPYYRIF